MFHRKQVVQNDIVARHMTRFFRTLPGKDRRDPEMVARNYGKFLWDPNNLVPQKRSSKSRFHVSLAIDNSGQDFDDLTKRAALISDTLLLSHHQIGNYHDIAESYNPDLPQRPAPSGSFAGALGLGSGAAAAALEHWPARKEWDRDHLMEMYGMYCPSLDELGRWILDAEPLLKAGLVWYLPSYATTTYRITNGVRAPLDKDKAKSDTVIDYLIRNGRAVDASGAELIKSQLVRHVLRIDLPFIEGINLREFSKITIEEFASYSAFRDFLRQSFLDMDTALNAVQSDRELLKLSLQIKDHVRSMRSEMETARRKKAVGVTGAVIGSVGAILVAVYGPELKAAIATLGATGGVWGIIHAATENSTRALREDKWYYVWALANKSHIHVL